jgi:hypothetical protein
VVTAAPAAFATQTRINAMDGGARGITMEDEATVFWYPAQLPNYGDMAFVDQLNPTFAGSYFGFHYAITDDLVLGIHGGVINSKTRASTYDRGFYPAGNTFTGRQGLGVGFHASQATDTAAGGTTNGMVSGGGANEVSGLGGMSIRDWGGVQGAGAGADAIGDVDLKIGMMFGARFGGFRLGLMFNVLGDDANYQQPDDPQPGPTFFQTDQGALLIDLAIGTGFDLPVGDMDLYFGVEIGEVEDFRDAFDNAGIAQNLLEHWDASHFAIRFGARAQLEASDTTTIVPHLSFAYGSQSVEHLGVAGAPQVACPTGTCANQNATWDAFNFAFGADVRLELWEDVFVVPGIGMMYAQQNLSGPVTIDRDLDYLVTFPYYGFGLDIKIFKYVDFRFGANQYVHFGRTTAYPNGTPAHERRESFVATTFATGLGLNIPVKESTLSLDLNINPLHWLDGPTAITGSVGAQAAGAGAVGTGNWGIDLALKYDW